MPHSRSKKSAKDAATEHSVEALKAQLADQQAHQAATNRILEVIKSSKGDAQPVFNEIAKTSVDLGRTKFCMMWRFDGALIHYCASYGFSDAFMAEYLKDYPCPPKPLSMAENVIKARKTYHMPDAQSDTYFDSSTAIKHGYSYMISVPIWDGAEIWGMIILAWPTGDIPDQARIDLIETFAGQASIAIDNARMFQDTQAALTRQTATADILRVISGSPTDVQPVFDVIVKSAAEICKARHCLLLQINAGMSEFRASYGLPAGAIEEFGLYEAIPLHQSTVTGQTYHAGKTITIADTQSEEFYDHLLARKYNGGRATGVPIRVGGRIWGVISLGWFAGVEPRPGDVELVETFADQASIAIENARLFNETQEALEQQTATAEVLKVISQSAFDLPTVLQALIEAAAKLCEASICILFNRVGDELHVGANTGCTAEFIDFHLKNPHKITRHNIAGRSVLERATVHVPDIEADAEFQNPKSPQLGGWRSIIAVPLIREGEVIGVLDLARPVVGPFTQRQIELVESFADQAVIAINNANLFEEVQARTAEVEEALKYQTATSEVLGVISRSPNELAPVLSTILEVASRLCHPEYAYVALLNPDDGRFHILETKNASTEFTQYLRANPIAPGYGTCTGRTALLGETVYIEDTEKDDTYEWKEAARLGKFQSTLGVPLIKDGVTVGVISLAHGNVSAFSSKQIALVETFAAQAVIAISNARLFDEVQARTAEVTEALVREQASAEILRVINQATSDLQPMFDLIAKKSAELCGASFCTLDRYDNDLYHLCAHHGFPEERLHLLERGYPFEHLPGHMTTRVMDSGKTEQIPNAQTGDFYDPELAKEAGFKRMLGVPIHAAGRVWGAIVLAWPSASPPTDASVELVQTFANQASIAIENARLLRETQERTAEVEEALVREQASAEILQVISEATTDLQPVFDLIVKKSAELCGARFCVLDRFDGEYYHFGAQHGFPDEMLGELTEDYPLKHAEGQVAYKVIQSGQTSHIENAQEGDYFWPEFAREVGFRHIMAVPVKAQGVVWGAISLGWPEAKLPPTATIELVQRFANQASIAIENARLLRETQERTAEVEEALEYQTATSEVLGVISRSPNEVQPVLDVILQVARRICAPDSIYAALLDLARRLRSRRPAV